MVPGVIKLEPNWATRYKRVAPDRLYIGDLSELQGLAIEGPALPGPYQSALPIDLTTYLPDPIGRYPLGPFLPRYQRAFAQGLGVDDFEGDPPDLEWAPPPPQARPVLAITNRQRHTNFRLDIAAAVDTPVIPSDPWRTYLLIVNEGATDCFLGFDKGATDGVPIASGGGFLELTNGTTSSVRARGDGGATVLKVLEARSNPASACVLPCEAVN